MSERTVLSEQLHAALQSRVPIEQVKRMLSERAGIDLTEALPPDAQTRPQHRLPSHKVAWQVLDGTLDQTVLQSA